MERKTFLPQQLENFVDNTLVRAALVTTLIAGGSSASLETTWGSDMVEFATPREAVLPENQMLTEGQITRLEPPTPDA